MCLSVCTWIPNSHWPTYITVMFGLLALAFNLESRQVWSNSSNAFEYSQDGCKYCCFFCTVEISDNNLKDFGSALRLTGCLELDDASLQPQGQGLSNLLYCFNHLGCFHWSKQKEVDSWHHVAIQKPKFLGPCFRRDN